jgi:hypothetical protein
MNMENTGMNGLEWSQTANIAYRSMNRSDQEILDRILNSQKEPKDLLLNSRPLNDNLYIFPVPQSFFRLMLLEDGSKIRLMDILDKRVVDAFWGRNAS